MVEPDTCIGCRSYDSFDGKCWVIVDRLGLIKAGRVDCPCANCLVKIMCNRACNDLERMKWEIETYEIR